MSKNARWSLADMRPYGARADTAKSFEILMLFIYKESPLPRHDYGTEYQQ